ncbi:CaiB/BaiF CoA transferase family protein [Aliiroseovarius sp. PTFE2010]|uniref:CaiB/BaiF CoA transferase family protein n=1 Tax=Aliiroseovarius sp. PTFE2010 TaxID=3417190 RepID=UPI003CF6168F
MSSSTPAGPLDGITVLDLTAMLSGPFATMVLGDLGARIIKVESSDGDMVRPSARLPGNDDPKSYGGYFQSINRNKESIVVDLKSAEGKDIIRKLVAQADIVVENFRAGVMDRLDLSYEQLSEIKPDLVYGCIRGFGDARTGRSPYADWPAFDVVAQAMGGIMGITGPSEQEPMKIGAGIGDTVPSLFLATGVLAALHRARSTGESQFVDVGMYDSVLAVCERIVYQHSYFGENPGPEGSSHPLLCPFGLFPTTDGHVAIACPRDHFWAILAEEMGQPDLADDPRFKTNEARVKHREATQEIVGEWTSRQSKKQIMDRLGGRIPLGPVNRAADIFADPHVAARKMLTSVEQPGADGRKVQIVDTPIHVLETPGGIRSRGPLLGEHTDRVLSEIGYDPDEITELHAAGVIA